MRAKNVRKALKQVWRWVSVRQENIKFAAFALTTCAMVAGLFGFVIWCTSRCEEMCGRTSALMCETSYRGTTCRCGWRTNRQIFVPTGELPTETCGEDD